MRNTGATGRADQDPLLDRPPPQYVRVKHTVRLRSLTAVTDNSGKLPNEGGSAGNGIGVPFAETKSLRDGHTDRQSFAQRDARGLASRHPDALKCDAGRPRHRSIGGASA